MILAAQGIAGGVDGGAAGGAKGQARIVGGQQEVVEQGDCLLYTSSSAQITGRQKVEKSKSLPVWSAMRVKFTFPRS